MLSTLITLNGGMNEKNEASDMIDCNLDKNSMDEVNDEQWRCYENVII